MPVEPVLTRAEVRDVDRRAIEQYHLPGIVLMENAGRGAAELLLRLGCSGRVVICAGKGNNGGDGFVIARHLLNRAAAGLEVEVLLFCEPSDLSGDAATNYRILQAAGLAGTVLGARPDPLTVNRKLASAIWIVDALLGTGTQGEIREPYRTVIESINKAGKRVLAVDLPSGLDCDTGKPLGPCVRANDTATFVARKLGFDSPSAAEWIGKVHVIDIGAPARIVAEIIADRKS